MDRRRQPLVQASHQYKPAPTAEPTAAPPPDTTAPNTSISSGPAASTTATSASLGFTSSESGASFECKLDSASYGACVSPKAYSGLAVGSHQFSVRAKDAAGNLDSTPALRSWTVKAAAPPPDTTAPNTSISSGPAASTTATSASLGFTSSESGASFECKLDSASYGACVSPKAYSGLAVGSHQFSVRAKDAAGNLDSTPALRSWTVKAAAPPPDTTAPNTSISSGPAASTTATSASLGFTSSESGASFECKLDSASYGACVSPKAYSGLAVGSHQFSVRAKDAAGNLDSTPALRSWTVKAAAPPPDTTAPNTSISSGPAASTTATSASRIHLQRVRRELRMQARQR